MNVLLSSVGRRVEIVRFFKAALENKGKVYAADIDPTAPGLYEADAGFLLPRVNDPEFVEVLLEFCKERKISLVVPLIDPELPILAEVRELFLKYGIWLLVSDLDVIAIGTDKLKTAEFFLNNNIPTPITFSPSVYFSRRQDITFPLVVKPRFGSAGKDVFVCNSHEEVEFYLKRINEPLIQSYLKGVEITIDVLCDLDGKGNVLSVVPRQRLKIRGGEVERGITRKDKHLIEWGKRIAECLKPRGPINIQCFLTENGPFFTEINPRFGGGYPLSYYAGADFPSMLIKMVEGERIAPVIGKFEDRLVMMRYDVAVIRKENELLS